VWAVRVSPFAKNTSIATCIPQPPSSDGGINNSYYYTLYAPVSRLSLRLSENEDEEFSSAGKFQFGCRCPRLLHVESYAYRELAYENERKMRHMSRGRLP
jgi:hypothetical protein